jgi:hypothetical protein
MPFVQFLRWAKEVIKGETTMAILKIRDKDGKVTEILSIKGKSAYEYAKDGGYTGTEEEFAYKLNNEVKEHNLSKEAHPDIRLDIQFILDTLTELYPVDPTFEKAVNFTADEFFYLYVERVWDGTLEFYNGTTWVAITANDPEYDGKRIPAVRYPWGYSVYVRGKNNTTITAGGTEQWKFLKEPTGHDNDDLLDKYPNANLYPDYTGEVSCGGNLKYLLDYEIDSRPANSKPIQLQDGCFAWMFYNYSYEERPLPYKLVSAPELPSIKEATVSNYCYQGMFCKCNSLTAPPVLPDSALATGCYQSMFEDSGVRYTPTFHSAGDETLGDSCYSNMFKGCTNLIYADSLYASKVGQESYLAMFAGCTNLVSPPSIYAVVLGNMACAWMFSGCSNLERASAFRNNVWMSWRACYTMYENCIALTDIPEIKANGICAESCAWMFAGCKSIFMTTVSGEGHITPYRIQATSKENLDDLLGMFTNIGNIYSIFTPNYDQTYYLSNVNKVIPAVGPATIGEENI